MPSPLKLVVHHALARCWCLHVASMTSGVPRLMVALVFCFYLFAHVYKYMHCCLAIFKPHHVAKGGKMQNIRTEV